MKILAFSDLHGDWETAEKIVAASRDADVVVGAGDFATKGEGLAETFDVLRRVSIPVVFVPGNHDNLAEMQADMRIWPAAHLLHGRGVVIQGVPFFGLGYETPAREERPWIQHLEERDAARLLAPCPAAAVLVTHSPPFGVADVQRNGEHEGSRAVRAIIKRQAPRLVLCGHIHHAWGMTGAIGPSPVHNLGPTLGWFDV